MHDLFGPQNVASYIAILAFVSACVYAIIKFTSDRYNSVKERKFEFQKNFETTVSKLSSENKTSQLSAAIILRRYFSLPFRSDEDKYFLKRETINVISSVLRTLPTSVFQKALGDGLAYAKDLSTCDLQNTNLQDVFLGTKSKNEKVIMNNVDLFRADLSCALIDNVIGIGTTFYNAILFGTRIKNSDFSHADFRGADLSNTLLRNVTLFNAQFENAYNIPQEIKDVLDENYQVSVTTPITTSVTTNGKNIFFSMPGNVTKPEEIIIKEYKKILQSKGYNVISYTRDEYPSFGQLGKIRHSIQSTDAMIAFGFKQINIEKGFYRPNTENSEALTDKWLPTPWNELEVGMGLMCDLPILLVKEKSIATGVFDKSLSECFVASIPAELDTRLIDRNEDFNRWLSLV